MARPTLGEKPMTKRLSISLLPHQQQKLRDFSERSNISAAWIGRSGIDLMIELIEQEALPRGTRGTVIYMLQQKLRKIRASNATAGKRRRKKS